MEDKYTVVLAIAALVTCGALIWHGQDGLIVGALCTLIGYVARMLGEKS